jgi:hypothetical protein
MHNFATVLTLTFAVISFIGCGDREMEKRGPNPPLPGPNNKVISVAAETENVKNFALVDAPILKGLIGKTNWAMHPDQSESVAYAVKRMDAHAFKRSYKGRGSSKSVFGVNKRLAFGEECSTASLNSVKVSPIKSEDHMVVNIKGCLSVEPKGFALFELNIIAGADDFAQDLNVPSSDPPNWKHVFDAPLWKDGTPKTTSTVSVEPSTNPFLKKLQAIVEPLFTKEGLLNDLKVSAIMFRLSRFNTKRDGKGIGLLIKQSVEPIVLYVSTPSDEE